jgi:hypothetical protein
MSAKQLSKAERAALEADRASLKDAIAKLAELREETAAIRRDLEAEDLDNVARESFRARLREQSDVDIIIDLLGIQKVAENLSVGPGRVASQAVSTAIAEVLNRFVPVTFGEALDRYFAECDADALE